MCLVLHGYFDIADHGFQHLQFRPFSVAGIYDVPWCCGCVGVTHVAGEYFFTFFVMFILPFVKICHTPSGVFVIQKQLLTFLLLIPVNLHEKFQHQIAVICELAFEAADTVDPSGIFLSCQTAFQTFPAGLLHPAGIQECEFAGFRDLPEISVQERIPQVFCRGS